MNFQQYTCILDVDILPDDARVLIWTFLNLNLKDLDEYILLNFMMYQWQLIHKGCKAAAPPEILRKIKYLDNSFH